jgi:3-oxoacyl-[acyl-carrier protein] reductase
VAEAEQVVAELKGTGGNAIAIQGDVANPADVERLFNETVEQFGSVDIVVHNSGIMPLSPIGKAEVDLFDKVISTNLRGAFLGSLFPFFFGFADILMSSFLVTRLLFCSAS